jgi:hypothetical protein
LVLSRYFALAVFILTRFHCTPYFNPLSVLSPPISSQLLSSFSQTSVPIPHHPT